MAQVPITQRSSSGQLTKQREHPMQRLRQDFDTLVNRLWGGWLSPFDQDLASTRMWDFDVTENDKEITVRAEMPGFEEDELDIQLNNETLTIKAQKEQRDEGKEEYCSFYRSVTLPTGVDTENVRATYRNGVLEMHIPRSPGSQPKRIKVEGSQQAGTKENKQSGNGAQGNPEQTTQAE